jgi:hypothetical protein
LRKVSYDKKALSWRAVRVCRRVTLKDENITVRGNFPEVIKGSAVPKPQLQIRAWQCFHLFYGRDKAGSLGLESPDHAIKPAHDEYQRILNQRRR